MGTADYWQPVPLGWRDAPAVSALAVRVKKRDPRLLLLDLWDWAHCFGWTHPVAIAAEAIEKGAGWHGRRGVLYTALVETGWVREADGVATICRWKDDAIVVGRPTTRKVAVKSADERTDEKRERDRIRKQKSRDSKRDIHASQPVTERDNCDTRDGHTVTPVTPNQKPLVLKQSVTPQEQEQEQEKNQSKNLALFAPAPSAAVGEVISPPGRGRPPKDTSPEAEAERAAERADGDRWMAEVRKLMNLTAEELRWSTGTFMQFRRQRKARGMEQLMRSLEGLQNDPFAKTKFNYIISDAGIVSGLAKWKKEAGTTHISRQYGEIDPELGF
jgi:hypothetical protein